MRRSSAFWVALLVACLQVLPVGADAAPPVTLIKAGRVLDVRSGLYRLHQGVLVEKGRIARIGPLSQVQADAPPDAVVVDLGDATLLPGLIDCHTHLLDARRPAIAFYANNALRILQRDPQEQTALGEQFAREMVEAGFTSVRDLGDATNRRDVMLRDAIAAGRIVGPRMQVAVKKLTPPLGQHLHAVTPMARQIAASEYLLVHNPDEARRAVKNVVAAGADVVKVIVDDGALVISPASMKAIVDEAHRLHRRVAAHAHTGLAIKTAIAGGADSIEHANEATDDDLRAMQRRGIVLVPTDLPTAAVWELLRKALPPVPEPRPELDEYVKQQVKLSPPRLKRALALKVKLAMGSDLVWRWPGRTRGQQALLVFEAYRQAGLTPLQILRSATLDAAALMGWQSRVGAVEAGKDADLIAVRGDPLHDSRALNRVAWVMTRGVVVKNQLQPQLKH